MTNMKWIVIFKIYIKLFENKDGMRIKDKIAVFRNYEKDNAGEDFKIWIGWVLPGVTDNFWKKIKKACICCVFAKDNLLFVANYYLSDYYSYTYNREMYNKIIKTIFEYKSN